jgi:hypothetical protein
MLGHGLWRRHRPRPSGAKVFLFFFLQKKKRYPHDIKTAGSRDPAVSFRSVE